MEGAIPYTFADGQQENDRAARTEELEKLNLFRAKHSIHPAVVVCLVRHMGIVSVEQFGFFVSQSWEQFCVSRKKFCMSRE